MGRHCVFEFVSLKQSMKYKHLLIVIQLLRKLISYFHVVELVPYYCYNKLNKLSIPYYYDINKLLLLILLIH